MDKLRIGVIGVGGRGVLANLWRDNPRSIIVAGADVSNEKLADFKERMGEDVYTTLEYRDMLERPDIDAVAVLSPDFVHEEQTIAALQAGKHVYVEKPMAITIEGCDRMIRAEKESGKKLMVGHNMRCMNNFKIMKEIIESGTIGEIKAVWVRHFVASGGYWYYHDWHATRDKSTSLLLQKGSHDIDMIHWLSGQYTKKVSAFGSLDFYGGDKPNDLTCPKCDENRTCEEATESGLIQCAFREEIDVEDNNVMIMELDGGIKASYLECHFATDYHRNFVFIGTKGTMENLDLEQKVTVKLRRKNCWNDPIDRIYNVPQDKRLHGGADTIITDQFVSMILDGIPPVASPLDGRMSVAAGYCGAVSMRNGGIPVEIPPL